MEKDWRQINLTINCAYCGHICGPYNESREMIEGRLREHIEHCDKHPVFEMRKQIKELEKIAHNVVDI